LAETIHLDVVATAHSRGLKDAERDLRGLRGEADKTGKSFQRTSDETFNLDREIVRAQHEMRRLNDEFKRTGDMNLVTHMRRQRAELNEFLRAAGRAAPKIGDTIGSGMLDFGGRGIRPVHALIGALVAAVAMAAPTIGAMIAGAVTGAVGLGGVVGGIIAASKSPAVRTAAKNFAEHVSSSFFQMGDQFVEPLVGAFDILRQGWDDLNFEQAFESVAGYVDDIAHGIAGFGRNFMGGFAQALKNAGPILELLRIELPRLGSALGYMFERMSRGQGTVEGFVFFMRTLQATIQGVGNIIGWLTDRFHEMLNIERTVFEFLGRIPGNPMKEFFTEFASRIEQLQDEANTGGQALNYMGRELQNSAGDAQATADAVNKLNDALFEQQNRTLAASNATLAYEGDMIRMKESVDEHGTSLRRNTEAGNQNRVMINNLISDLIRERDAAIEAAQGNTQKVNAAKKKYNEQIQKLQELLVKLGFEKAEIARIINAYKAIPTQVTTKIIQDYQTRGVPAGEHSGVRIGETRGRAVGGPIWPGSWKVGEHGPEYMRINADGTGYVYPERGSSRNSGSGGGSLSAASAGRPVIVSGGGLGELVYDWLVREVRRRGGTLAVLGLRAS